MKIKVNEKLLGGGLCTCMFPFMIDKKEENTIKKESKVNSEEVNSQENSTENNG